LLITVCFFNSQSCVEKSKNIGKNIEKIPGATDDGQIVVFSLVIKVCFFNSQSCEEKSKNHGKNS